MFFTRSYFVLAAASVCFASSVSNHPLTLRARLGDHSWDMGHSTLVAVGADATCNAIFSCADCNTAQICRPTAAGGFVPVTTVTCPADRPYCDYGTGSCTTVPDASCGQTDDFICLKSEGNFPDKDCKQYHVCDNYVAHKFECKISGQNYNADSGECEASTKCASFNCDGSGKKVASSLYPSYYSYCEPGSPGQPGVIDRCQAVNQLNATSQLCEPICSTEGVIQDVEDCTKYYLCSYLWINETTKFLVRERLDCPPNTGFDPDNFICVSLPTPACQSPTNPPPTTAAITTQATTAASTTQATTAAPTTQAPTIAPTTQATTAAPTTEFTTAAPTTQAPTIAPTTQATTAAP